MCYVQSSVQQECHAQLLAATNRVTEQLVDSWEFLFVLFNKLYGQSYG